MQLSTLYPVVNAFSTMPLISDPKRRRECSVSGGVSVEDMPFYHFNPAEKPKPKFKTPRKRANILFHEINQEAIDKDKSSKLEVFGEGKYLPFRVGDAIELTMVDMGGVNSDKLEKIRGVVLGMRHRGLGSCVYIRDVVYGHPIDRHIPFHSPLLKSIKVLEKNFVFKGKRKVKRAKLYYLRDLKDEETRVTKY